MTSPIADELGFVGAGALTAAMVAGLRRSGVEVPRIHLSPRGEDTSQRLSRDFPNVQRAPDNQAVVDRSSIVFLAVRPPQLDAVLAGLTFRHGQVVVSLVAGRRADSVAEQVQPATSVCRAIPLAGIAHREGPIVLYPHIGPVAALLAPLGDLVVARSEEEVVAYGCASGLISSYFALQNTAISWLEDEGVPREQSSRYIRSMLASLAASSTRTPDAGLADLPGEYETAGGLNERTRRHLAEAGWFDQVRKALDALDGGKALQKG